MHDVYCYCLGKLRDVIVKGAFTIDMNSVQILFRTMTVTISVFPSLTVLDRHISAQEPEDDIYLRLIS